MSTHDHNLYEIDLFFQELVFFLLHEWDDSKLLLPTSFFGFPADGSFSRPPVQLFVQADVSFVFVPRIFRSCVLLCF